MPLLGRNRETGMFPWQRNATGRSKNQLALSDLTQGVDYSWQQVAQAVQAKVTFLQAQGLNEGAIIALSGKNSVEMLLFYLAGLQAKMPVLCLNPAFSTDKIRQLCQQSAVQFLLEFREELTITHWQRNSSLPQSFTLTLTSGSTGLPKAVVHSVQNHWDNAQGVCDFMGFGTEHSWLLSLPLYHVSGQGIVWRWLCQGAVLRLPSQDFYADALGSTHLSLVPTQALRLLDYVQQHPQTAVKTQAILLGGSQISPNLCQKLTALGIEVYSGYGMTEMASTIFAKRFEPQDPNNASVGQPLAGREFQIINDEIWLRGAGLGLGYWNGEAILPLTNAQGWLATKDKGEWNGKDLCLLGRLDNMFISGGENIQPEEIEQIIQQHSEVEQVFILPISDAEFGQRPVAMVKFKAEFSQTAVQNLQDWLQHKLERFKQPVRYFPLEITMQGNIKISRADLKAQLIKLMNK